MCTPFSTLFCLRVVLDRAVGMGAVFHRGLRGSVVGIFGAAPRVARARVFAAAGAAPRIGGDPHLGPGVVIEDAAVGRTAGRRSAAGRSAGRRRGPTGRARGAAGRVATACSETAAAGSRCAAGASNLAWRQWMWAQAPAGAGARLEVARAEASTIGAQHARAQELPVIAAGPRQACRASCTEWHTLARTHGGHHGARAQRKPSLLSLSPASGKSALRNATRRPGRPSP
jgi:hypothetical protein